jgi:Phage holin T7 family, holin superfamily II
MKDRTEILEEAIKSAPPVVVAAGTTVFGLSLNEWVAVLTIIYIVLQIGFLAYKAHLLRQKKTNVAADD